MSGIKRIKTAFEKAQAKQSAAFMPYFTLGYPDRAQSVEAITALAEHSDLLELGVPFSDPIADGPTVQRSTQLSLENGTTVKTCLDMVRDLRAQGVDTPAMLMGYYNPLLAYGLENYVRDAAAAGVDGFIVPDLPPEEADELAELATKHGIAYIYFVAPTSHPQRIKAVTEKAQGFIYMVSVAGVTGERSKIAAGLDQFVETIRSQTETPVAVGFGIKSAEQAAEVSTFADGVIVGSALINAYDSDGVAGLSKLSESLVGGLK